jgi:hypothetical protein
VDEKVDFFDDLEAETWSLLWFDDFVEQLGYEKSDKLKIFWLLPRKEFPDGLRILLTDSDTIAMANVAHKIKNFVVYFDHDDIADGISWDDIVANPVTKLPKALSPHKEQHLPKKDGDKLPVFYTDSENRTVHQFKSTEQSDGFFDSDYEIEDGDEDILETFADENEGHVGHVCVKDNKKAKGSRLKYFVVDRPNVESEEEDTDDEGLDLPELDGEGEDSHRFKSFRDEDIESASRPLSGFW